MSDINRDRLLVQVRGNGSEQAVEIEARSLIERALLSGAGKVKVNGYELPVTDQELLVPLNPDEDTVTFEAANGVDLTLVLLVMQQ